MENGNRIINGNCWVAYFDILGFRNEVRKHEGYLQGLVDLYYEVLLRKIRSVEAYWPDKVFIYWFSDSFLFYTLDDSLESFSCIEQETRHFFIGAIEDKIPFRGALTMGEFYADEKKHVFVGQALIDAHDFAEKQNWVGFVLTPQACDRLREIDPIQGETRSIYQDYNVPIKPQKVKIEKLLACRISKCSSADIEVIIEQMLKEAENELDKSDYDKVKAIYENTLKSIRDTKD